MIAFLCVRLYDIFSLYDWRREWPTVQTCTAPLRRVLSTSLTITASYKLGPSWNVPLCAQISRLFHRRLIAFEEQKKAINPTTISRIRTFLGAIYKTGYRSKRCDQMVAEATRRLDTTPRVEKQTNTIRYIHHRRSRFPPFAGRFHTLQLPCIPSVSPSHWGDKITHPLGRTSKLVFSSQRGGCKRREWRVRPAAVGHPSLLGCLHIHHHLVHKFLQHLSVNVSCCRRRSKPEWTLATFFFPKNKNGAPKAQPRLTRGCELVG